MSKRSNHADRPQRVSKRQFRQATDALVRTTRPPQQPQKPPPSS